MSGIDDRHKAMEAKLHHDDELRFKATARRNSLLAAWAGEKLGKSGDEMEAYRLEVIRSDFEEVGDDDVLRKVAGDLASAGVSEAEVRAKMDELLLQAAVSVSDEG